MSFVQKRRNGVTYYTIEDFDKTGLVKHGFSTRLGGVSTGELNSLNLGVKKDDNKKNILENYDRFSRALGINMEDLVLSNQVHEDNIVELKKEDRGKGLLRKSDLNGVDGFITDNKEVALVTFYADCVPLFFLDPSNEAIGLSHSGWKGTAKQIGKKTLEKMIETYNTNPEKVLVGIGPSIGQCCFEVGGEVVEEFKKNFAGNDYFYSKDNGKYMLDLWRLNKRQLLDLGVKESNITVSEICTKCNKDIFFSHRGDNGRTGSMSGIIQLR